MKAFLILAAAFALTACSDDDQRYLFSYDRPDAKVHDTTVATNAPPPQPAAPAVPVAQPAPVQSAPLPPPPQVYREPPPRPPPPPERRVSAPVETAQTTTTTTVVETQKPMPPQTVYAPVAETPPVAPPAAVEAQCRAIAAQRAEDGALNGYDEDTQKVIEDGTFRDCMTWTPTHN
ncbi:MAG TPA: hypothetical protein VGG10_07305 [Rhizomicrobium sp.]|jgi:hypothetical protein